MFNLQQSDPRLFSPSSLTLEPIGSSEFRPWITASFDYPVLYWHNCILGSLNRPYVFFSLNYLETNNFHLLCFEPLWYKCTQTHSLQSSTCLPQITSPASRQRGSHRYMTRFPPLLSPAFFQQKIDFSYLYFVLELSSSAYSIQGHPHLWADCSRERLRINLGFFFKVLPHPA